MKIFLNIKKNNLSPQLIYTGLVAILFSFSRKKVFFPCLKALFLLISPRLLYPSVNLNLLSHLQLLRREKSWEKLRRIRKSSELKLKLYFEFFLHLLMQHYASHTKADKTQVHYVMLNWVSVTDISLISLISQSNLILTALSVLAGEILK